MRLAPSPIFLQGLSKFDNFYPWKFHQISIFTSCVGELWKIWLFSHHALENFEKYDWLNPFEIEVIKEYCIRCNIFLGFFLANSLEITNCYIYQIQILSFSFGTFLPIKSYLFLKLVWIWSRHLPFHENWNQIFLSFFCSFSNSL